MATLREIMGDEADNISTSYNVNDGTTYNMCPICRVGSFREESIHSHMYKCMKDQKKKNPHIRKCPFDSCHLSAEAEYEDHINCCPSRLTFDAFRFSHGETRVSADIPKPPAVATVEEEWDTNEHPTYDTEKELQERCLLVKKAGAQPAERRKYRNEQRSKFVNK